MYMNTKIIGLIAIAAVVAIGGFFLLSGSKDEPSEEMATNTLQDTAEEEGTDFTGSLFDLARRGGDWKCTIDVRADMSSSATAVSGVVYVSGNNVRADFTTTVPSVGEMTSYMIADDTSVYSWSSMTPQGVKVARDMAEESSSSPEDMSGGGVSADQSYGYNCMPTTVDAALFVPPTDVSFMSM